MNHTAPTEIYTLSLHDALPIYTPTSTEASGRKPAIRRVPMTALFQWTTANPFRAFLAAGLAALVALVELPMAAWLPAGVVVLCLLAAGPPVALAALAGAAIALVWAFTPAFGPGPALLIAVAS